MRNRNNTPYIFKARFASKCNETGLPIEKGEEILYFPYGKSAYKKDTKQWQKFHEEMFDEMIMGN